MKAHQKMIDVAANNLANLNTTAFKSSSVTFAEMLSETISQASGPTSNRGGRNPVEVGSGVTLGGVNRNMSQGGLLNTGESLDMAIEGAGYFVLNDGTQDVYTRVGTFAVDSGYYLVDPNTGNRLQRIGNFGVDEGFQVVSSSAIRIPYDISLPATPTTEVAYSGNLSADESSATTHLMTVGTQLTATAKVASGSTLIQDLDQATGTFTGTIAIDGTNPDGTDATLTNVTVDATTDVDDVLAGINTAFTGATASLVNGYIRLTDTTAGYSRTDMTITITPTTGTLTLPKYVQILTAGGLATKTNNIEIFDSQGMSHVMSTVFAKSDTNTWDMVLTSITGDVELTDRRIRGIKFLADGSYGGMDATIGDTSSFEFGYDYDGYINRTIDLQMGQVGEFDGLSQFGGTSTVAPANQDGYAAGSLSSVSVTSDGVLTGVFTNGVRKDIAAVQIAVFQNPAGMSSIGNNYYEGSANSGEAVTTQAMSGGAGSIRGGSLEGSNVDVASEFVSLIQGQSGYQANARTIRVSTEMLKELTNLIR